MLGLADAVTVYGAAAEEATLRAGVEQAAAAGDLTAWVVAHVELSKALLRSARAADAIAHLWPAVQDAPKEASAPLRYQLALALALDRQHASAEPLLRQVRGAEHADLQHARLQHACSTPAPYLHHACSLPTCSMPACGILACSMPTACFLCCGR